MKFSAPIRATLAAGVCTSFCASVGAAEQDAASGPILLAQNSNASAATGQSSKAPLEEIVVSGIRESIQQAQDIKRIALSNIEVITQEDLGKFADSSISDALQRVPGVFIEHNAFGLDSFDGVTIRGLGPDYLATTVNGRDQMGITGFFGSGGRDFDYASVPPEILGAVTVYKAPTASLFESGLAGEINMNTLRPLQVSRTNSEGLFGSVNVSDVYDFRAHKGGPRFSGIAGAKLFDNTLGFYIAGVYSNQYAKVDRIQEYNGKHDVSLQNADGSVTVKPNTGTVDGFSPSISYREYQKRSIAADLEWKPLSSLNVNLDMQDNKFNTLNDAQGGDFYSGFQYETTPAGASPLFPIYKSGSYTVRGNQLVGFNDSQLLLAPGTPADFTYSGALHDYNYNEFTNEGLNVAWEIDPTKTLTLDYAHGNSEYFDNWRNPSVDTTVSTLGGGLNTAYDGSGKVPVVTVIQAPGINISDPASYGDTQYFGFQSLTRQKRDQARLDFEDHITDDLAIKVGARRSQTLVKDVLAYAPSPTPGSLPSAGLLSGSNHFYGYNVSIPNFNFNAFCSQNPAYCSASNYGVGSFLGWNLPSNANGSPGDPFLFQAPNSYRIRETNTAFYTQLDDQGRLLGIDYSGNIGVRGVHIQEKGVSYQGTTYVYSFGGGVDPVASQNNSSTLFYDNNSLWKVLPAANLLLKPTDTLHFRLGIAKTMSLPAYSSLSPNVSLQIHTPFDGGTDQSTLNGGNLHLNPTTAWNYDFTTEYYTENHGAIIASLFYKDVKDLTTNVLDINSPIPPQYLSLLPANHANSGFNVSLPINGNYGKTYGAEIGANQPFTFLPSPFDGFGVQANYTYVASTLHVLGSSATTAFPGSSKNNVNATAYFEKYGWDARVAIAYRNSYLSSVASDDQSTYTYGYTSVDASVSYAFSPHLEVIFSGSNLTDSPILNYIGSGRLLQAYLERPRTFTLGVRASL